MGPRTGVKDAQLIRILQLPGSRTSNNLETPGSGGGSAAHAFGLGFVIVHFIFIFLVVPCPRC